MFVIVRVAGVQMGTSAEAVVVTDSAFGKRVFPFAQIRQMQQREIR